MKSFYLDIFQREVYRQCKFALMAYEDMINYQRKSNERFWFSVQSFLVAIANISKLFWPIVKIKKLGGENEEEYKKRKEQLVNEIKNRREELRESLSVSNNSPLKSKSMRNNFEHFDNEIEDWIKSSKSHNFADEIIMYEGAIKGLDIDDFMRVFNTTKNAITFKGQDYELEPIIKEIKNLYLLAKKVSEMPHWNK